MATIVEGISNGCIKASCALIGGETAEMPGFYKEDEYDIAGFSVGVVDKDKIINGFTIKEGDYLIGLPSSGIPVSYTHLDVYKRQIKSLSFCNFHHCLMIIWS